MLCDSTLDAIEEYLKDYGLTAAQAAQARRQVYLAVACRQAGIGLRSLEDFLGQAQLQLEEWRFVHVVEVLTFAISIARANSLARKPGPNLSLRRIGSQDLKRYIKQVLERTYLLSAAGIDTQALTELIFQQAKVTSREQRTHLQNKMILLIRKGTLAVSYQSAIHRFGRFLVVFLKGELGS